MKINQTIQTTLKKKIKMSSIKNVFTFSHLHLLYDLFVLSMKITFAMTVAAFKMVIPPRAKNLIGETVLVNK